MASSEILDFEQLLAPVPGESAVGVDLRTDTSPTSLYYEVKDCRSTARTAERQALMNGDGSGDDADWRPILATVPDVVSQSSKDLEIVAYFVEALVREHGFAGLRDGFRLLRELVTRYGGDIFPLPDEDGIETRVAPITGLNGEGAEGTLIGPINNIPITDLTDVGEFATFQYVEALDLARATDETRERRISQGAVELSSFEAAVSETSAGFFLNLIEDIDGAIDEYRQLVQVMDETYGEFSPPSSAIRSALESCRETVATVGRDKLATLAPVDADEAEAESDETGGATPRAASGSIETRDDALRAISKVAEFFRRTEPHSPISFALDRVVSWGRMPLPQLLKELIVDENAVDQMFKLVGIKESEPSEYEDV